jgi:putative DNA primase/helicase
VSDGSKFLLPFGVTTPKPANIAEVIEHLPEYFAQDSYEAFQARRLWVYRRGAFVPRGAEVVARHTKTILQHSQRQDSWSSRLGMETSEYIRISSPALPETPPLDTLNLQSGLLDVKTREQRPHNPKFLSAVQLPVVYDPTALCPAWERQIANTFPDDALDLAWAIVAYLMLPILAPQKAILLLGEGGSGKSTFLMALTKFLGLRNISTVSLQKLEENRFATSALVGKLVNIFADLPSRHLETCAVFKAITGGDLIESEFKFREPFHFKPYARLVFSSNTPPISRDASDSFFERWLVVPLNHKFRGSIEQRNRAELDAELSSQSELSGVLNKALDVLPDVLKHGLPEPASCLRAHEEFRSATDPFSIYLMRQVVVSPGAVIPKQQLLHSYNSYALRRGRPPMTETAFSLALKRRVRDIEEGKKTIGGERANCWIGIGFSENAEPETQEVI